MKNSITIASLRNFSVAAFFVISTWACSHEQVTPVDENQYEEQKIEIRTDLTSLANEVKIEVSQRDNIPVDQITGSYYFGKTTEGYYEYRLQTSQNGPKVYFVIGIIGEEIEGY